jgi:hypothetical protein
MGENSTAPSPLAELCFEWQKRLRLGDWNINFRVVRERDMYQTGRGGEISINNQHRSAWVTICDQLDLGDNELSQEHFIVHELIHLLLDPFFPKECEGLQFELAEFSINALAAALVRSRQEERAAIARVEESSTSADVTEVQAKPYRYADGHSEG